MLKMISLHTCLLFQRNDKFGTDKESFKYLFGSHSIVLVLWLYIKGTNSDRPENSNAGLYENSLFIEPL